jgi:molybdopterin converting factor small subunit
MPKNTLPPTPPTVTVVLPAIFMSLFPDSLRRVDLDASTVGDVLDALDSRWPGMRDRLRDSTPRIRRHINVFVGGRRATLETRLTPGEKVYVLTAMSGG